MKPVRHLCLPLLFLAAASAVLTAEEKGKLSRVAVAKRGKAATVYVESGPGSGSGFCVHASGLFVTNEHVVRNATAGGIIVVVNAGSKAQQVFKGSVVRADVDLDLALVRVEGAKDLPTLPLGSDADLEELTDVISIGFPFGSALGKKGTFPSVSVNAGSVTSLRRGKDNELQRIQLDAALNPGSSGGPVVDMDAKVVGVVVSGIRGSGVNMAIPVSHVQKFLARPDIAFTPPEVTKANQYDALLFRARAASLLPSKEAFSLELILSAEGKVRRFPMKLDDGVFQAKATAFSARKGKPAVRVEVTYDDGVVCGTSEDVDFEVGKDKVGLGEVISMRPGATTRVELADGRKLSGKRSALEKLTLKVGGQSLELDLARASVVKVTADENAGVAICTVVATQGGKEVERVTQELDPPGTSRAKLEAIREGKFHKPLRSATPTSYLKVVSSKGDSIGEGKNYNYKEDEITLQRGLPNAVQISVDGWIIVFAALQGGVLAPGEYPNATRAFFNTTTPGISFYGKGRGANTLTGAFVVWELEREGNQVTKLAVDFFQRCEGTQPPLYGMLRYKSSFR